MKRVPVLLIVPAFLAVVLFSAFTPPDEGEWLLTQLSKLPWKSMEQTGLKLSPAQIFDTSSTCLSRAIVLLPGGTGSYISKDGLIITNHHIAFAGIQSVSSVQDDYLKNGFNAATKDAELSLPNYTAEIVTAITDVTKDVLSAVSDTMSDAKRADAIRAKTRDMEQALRKDAPEDVQYRISEMYNGLQYLQFRFSVCRDVRLVYAPPASIGNYGGEVDNWMWPRHTGDFSLLRAYVGPDGKHVSYAKENVPYHPSVFLPISNKPLDENSFAMILGFPGRTFRYRTGTEIKLAKDELLPLQMKLFKEKMTIMERAGKNDRSTELKYATVYRRYANTEKNIDGTLEGMRRSDILTERAEREKAFTEFVNADPQRKQRFGNVLSEIASTYERYKTFDQKQIVLSLLLSSVDLVRLSGGMNELAASFAKDSTGKDAPNPKNASDMKRAITNTYKNFVLSVDKEFLAALLEDALELPAGQKIEPVERHFRGVSVEDRTKKVREFVDELAKHTKLADENAAAKMLDESADDIREDEGVKFAAALQTENAAMTPQFTEFNATMNSLRAKLIEAWKLWKGDNLYPDANRTLRLTYGTVKPYIPRDAVQYDYVTTLSGVIEKESNEDPFIVPQKLHDLWAKKDFGPYADPKRQDVPVAFIADLDITGGNSGSPVVNGNGELIGVAFDGNWEAVVGDYIFQDPINRAISVDSRYVLFILDKFSNAKNILGELVVH